jgi:hypothetical protein
MRRVLLFAFFLLCAVQSSVAVDTNIQQNKGGKLQVNEVQMPLLMAPVSVGGEFLGYHYIAAKVVTPSVVSVHAMRAKMAFIQDALVRDVYRTCVCMPDEPRKVDAAVLAERLAAVMRRIVGAKTVEKVVFIDIKFAPLHPPKDGTMFENSSIDSAPEAAGASGGRGKGDASPAPSQPSKDGRH